jgi:protein phosphatase PTC1
MKENINVRKRHSSFLSDILNGEEEYVQAGNSVMSYAYKEYSNDRYRAYMEDGHKIIDSYMGDPNQGYFAIFDGHGGSESVSYCKLHFHEELSKFIDRYPTSIESALAEAFESIDKFLYVCGHNQVGTTATICLIKNENRQRVLYTANVGDSAAVLVSDNKAEQLSYDHKATDKSEIVRVQNDGGCIYRGRLRGTLALTRSLGDHNLKSSGLSSKPNIVRTVLYPSHSSLIIASDGLWDVVSPSDLIPYKNFRSLDIASELIRYAIKCGSQDNIAVICINL